MTSRDTFSDRQLESGDDSRRRTDGLIALIIFAVALLARLIFLLSSPDRAWPHSVFYEGDAIMWVEWALAIDTGQAFQFNLPIHPPGVAYDIAYLYEGTRLTGFTTMKALWCVLSACACSLTYLACACTLSRRIAVIAALLLAFSFNQYVLATSLNNETPYVMVLAAIVLLTQRSIASPNRWIIALLGLSHGLAMLLRAEHPLLLVLCIVWMLGARVPDSQRAAGSHPRFKNRVALSGVTIAISILVCLPWTIHALLATHRFNTVQAAPITFNLAPVEWTQSAQQAIMDMPAFARQDNFAALNVFAQQEQTLILERDDVERIILDRFGWIPKPLPSLVFVSNQGPFSFALANHPQADGGFSRAALAHPMRGSDPTFAFAFPPHNEVFTDGWRVGIDFIQSDFPAWLHNVGRKFQRFADGVTSGFSAANLPLSRSGHREPVDMFVSDSRLSQWWQPLIIALIVMGVIFAWARRLPVGLWLLIILYKLIVTLAFYGYARQGASIAPAFFVLIAIANDSLLLPLDRKMPSATRRYPIVGAITCALLLAGDAFIWRRSTLERIEGSTLPRPELGTNAFQAFNRIEIR